MSGRAAEPIKMGENQIWEQILQGIYGLSSVGLQHLPFHMRAGGGDGLSQVGPQN